jgi:hypothetical protein
LFSFPVEAYHQDVVIAVGWRRFHRLVLPADKLAAAVATQKKRAWLCFADLVLICTTHLFTKKIKLIVLLFLLFFMDLDVSTILLFAWTSTSPLLGFSTAGQ